VHQLICIGLLLVLVAQKNVTLAEGKESWSYCSHNCDNGHCHSRVYELDTLL